MQHASRLAEGVAGARNRMRTEAGKMPECLIFPIRNGLGVSNDRFGFNSPGLGGEAGANLEELAQVSDVWLGITLVFYLLQGFVRRAVQFELEDIEVLRGLHDAVGTSLALLFLNVGGIHAHHPEYQVEGVIEVAFALLLVFLAPCRVGDAGQEGGEQVAQSVRLALAHGLHQGSYSDFMSSSGFR